MREGRATIRASAWGALVGQELPHPSERTEGPSEPEKICAIQLLRRLWLRLCSQQTVTKEMYTQPKEPILNAMEQGPRGFNAWVGANYSRHVGCLE